MKQVLTLPRVAEEKLLINKINGRTPLKILKMKKKLSHQKFNSWTELQQNNKRTQFSRKQPNSLKKESTYKNGDNDVHYYAQRTKLTKDGTLFTESDEHAIVPDKLKRPISIAVHDNLYGAGHFSTRKT
uniref:Uncharacterized protein n=1 Tax=Acrobeloides nanus TaxID=290746 RepID=A0A914D3D5_9BILA